MKKIENKEIIAMAVKFIESVEAELLRYYREQHSDSIKRALRAKKAREETNKKLTK